jgi:phage-related protein
MKQIKARFYRTASGSEPVREWLLALSKEDRKAIGTDIATVEFGWPIGLPVCRPMGKGLYEVRTDLPGKRTARVLFTIVEDTMVLLHGFIKKSRRTLKSDLNLAQVRKADVT